MGSAVCGQTSRCFCWNDDQDQRALQPKARADRRRQALESAEASEEDRWPGKEEFRENIQQLLLELFGLHDLNGNGLLEEGELVALNEKIAVLHHGPGTDTTEVREKYEALFRERLDPDGKPVGFDVFHGYASEVLESLDPDPEAQEMILEQFVAEAKSARHLFHAPDMATKEQLRQEQQRQLAAALLRRPLRPLHGGLLPAAQPPRGPAPAASSRGSSFGTQTARPQALFGLIAAHPAPYPLRPPSPAPQCLAAHHPGCSGLVQGRPVAAPQSPATLLAPPRAGAPARARGPPQGRPPPLPPPRGATTCVVGAPVTGVVAPGGWPQHRA